MARRKQLAADKRVKQQLEAQALNKQRLELQRKTDELEAERAPMRRDHASSLVVQAQRALDALRVAVGEERSSARERIRKEEDGQKRRGLEEAEAAAEKARAVEEAAMAEIARKREEAAALKAAGLDDDDEVGDGPNANDGEMNA